jgi:hypothetical protein
MFEISLELVLGLVFISVVFLVVYMPKDLKMPKNFKMSKPSLNISKSRKEREEKLKEIDKKLEEVLLEDFGKEKIVKLDEAAEEATKKFELKGDLLSEMQTSGGVNTDKNTNNISEGPKNEDISLPNVENLAGLEEIEKEVELEQADQQKEETKLEFEESDKLLEDLAKEVERREEEHFDLLRDLKGQKFSVEELESELKEVLERARKLKVSGISGPEQT